MSELMPEGAIEYWDVATRTYYERREDGTALSRPYNEAENAQADAQTNRRALVDRVLAASRATADDIAENAVFLTRWEPTSAEILQQVQALTRQSTRQGEGLSDLTRLALSRLGSTALVVE
ncbi:hypothetical protein ACGFRG_24835 [Streptomyces sp. NPDC048696]|uniref:hypothetical protein n=1 Tax=Streptomyces sp. NPDC048696 TaxID=3365585 RepID=UPI003721FDB3